MHAQGAGPRSAPADMERMSELYKEHCQAGAEQLALCKRARSLYYGVEEAGFSDKRHLDEFTYNKRSRELY
jgi:hypothetical protein